ncbi:hypothetical protein HOY80DRAFT_920646 [Tuber brumale]|nr:hypothetical protein HOY80DRAFT_920646 [Tuber brumale]
MGDDCSPRGGDWEENQIYSCNNRRDAFPANIGRPSYTSLLATCQRLQRQNSDKEEQLAFANQRIASLKLHNARLEDKVQSATIALEEQEKLRNRFISTFKRDKLHSDTPTDRETIREGNESAHGGDGISDAKLYTAQGMRQDHEVFEELYGLSPENLARIKNKKMIFALNMHATVRASKFKIATETYYRCFEKFVQQLKVTGNGPCGHHSNGTDSQLTTADWEFIHASATQVTNIRDKAHIPVNEGVNNICASKEDLSISSDT